MVAPQGMVLITIPASLPFEDGLVDSAKMLTVTFCSQLLETRLLRSLRFQFGEVGFRVLSFASTLRLHSRHSFQPLEKLHIFLYRETVRATPVSCDMLVEETFAQTDCKGTPSVRGTLLM